MKLGCCAYSYRDQLTSGAMTLESFIDTCADLGFDGVELTSYYFRDMERATLNALKRRCFARGLEVSGVAVGTDFCRAEAEARELDIAKAKSWIEHGVVLGAPFARVFAGPVPKGDTEDAAFARCIACLLEVIEHGERHGVVVGLENHGGITATAEQVERIVAAIGENPWFTVNLDLGNFRDPKNEFPRIIPHSLTMHAKVRYTDLAGARRDVDYASLRDQLAAAGYRGFLNVEYEEPEDASTGVPRFLAALRAVFG